jgi:HAD superfamily hydrolase (TIGR01509 family)
MPEIRGVILDIDGTLLLSNDAHARAFVDAAEELGIEASFDQIRRLIGKGGDKLIPEAFGFEKDSRQGKELDGRKGEIFRGRYLADLEPAPGARALLERLTERGVKLVVATSADKADLQALLEQAGVADLIEGSTSAGDVDASKPDPDVVAAALAETELPAEAVVMIGDTPYDVEAATRAGVGIIGVRCGGWPDRDLRGSLAVYADPEDLLANYAASPLGQVGS